MDDDFKQKSHDAHQVRAFQASRQTARDAISQLLRGYRLLGTHRDVYRGRNGNGKGGVDMFRRAVQGGLGPLLRDHPLLAPARAHL